jgi:hypothetical protein
MILEVAMIVIATSCLTFLHPGVCFKGSWSAADFQFRSKKVVDREKVEAGTDESIQNEVIREE